MVFLRSAGCQSEFCVSTPSTAWKDSMFTEPALRCRICSVDAKTAALKQSLKSIFLGVEIGGFALCSSVLASRIPPTPQVRSRGFCCLLGCCVQCCPLRKPQKNRTCWNQGVFASCSASSHSLERIWAGFRGRSVSRVVLGVLSTQITLYC